MSTMRTGAALAPNDRLTNALDVIVRNATNDVKSAALSTQENLQRSALRDATQEPPENENCVMHAHQQIMSHF